MLPAEHLMTPGPAPAVNQTKLQHNISFDDVKKVATSNILYDFNRCLRYQGMIASTTNNSLTGRSKSMKKIDIPDDMRSVVSPETMTQNDDGKVVKLSTTRMKMEHSTVSWSLYFQQVSTFIAFGVTSITTGLMTYLGIAKSRQFLMFLPFPASMSYLLWQIVEKMWSEQKFVALAKEGRQRRQGYREDPSQPVLLSPTEKKKREDERETLRGKKGNTD